MRISFLTRIIDPRSLSFADLQALRDEEVVECLKAGNDDALAVLFDRYERLVLSVASKILRDRGEAEDVTQNVFLEIYRAVGQFDAAKGSTRGWILQYAYHRSLNRRQQLLVRSHYRQDSLGVGDDLVMAMPRWGSLRQGEVRRFILQALGTLNTEQRQTIELVCFEGLSMKEIADQSGETLANVRHHYYRGLEKLRKLLTEKPGREIAPSAEEAIDAGA